MSSLGKKINVSRAYGLAILRKLLPKNAVIEPLVKQRIAKSNNIAQVSDAPCYSINCISWMQINSASLIYNNWG